MHRLLTFVLCLACLTVGVAGNALAGDDAAKSRLNLIHPRAMPYNQWAVADKQYLEQVCASQGETQQAAIWREYRAISRAVNQITVREACREPWSDARIFAPSTTGKLLVLQAAQKSRENILRTLAGGAAPEFDKIYVSPYVINGELSVHKLKGRYEIDPAAAGLEVDEVRAILSKMDILKNALAGYTIYLLPYTIQGFGGYSFSQGLAQIEEASFIAATRDRDTARTSLVHEIGHYIHQQYLGEYRQDNAKWAKYLKARGGKQWVDRGDWADTTVENFAEDFRILFGPETANVIPYRGAYGSPQTSPKTAERVGQFFIDVVLNKEMPGMDFREFGLYANDTLLAIPLNGLTGEHSAVIGNWDSKLQVRGLCYLTGAGNAKPVAYLWNDRYEKMQSLTMDRDGVFTADFIIPGAGSYELILGTLAQDKVTVYKTIKIYCLPLESAAVAERTTGGTDATITRGEFITKLVGEISGPVEIIYDDVPARHPAAPGIAAAAAAGLINPHVSLNGHFCPDDVLTVNDAYTFCDLIIRNKLNYHWNPYVIGIGSFPGRENAEKPLTKSRVKDIIKQLREYSLL